MAGIYLHIPFCRKACTYCDFHFSTKMDTYPLVVEAMQRELVQRAQELKGQTVDTVYFGGGTPSVLAAADLQRLIETIHREYSVHSTLEFTFEVNPEDVSKESLKTWKRSGINRLSMGIQSFRDEDLAFMNRNHVGGQSEASIKAAQDEGFENLTIDLIYGVPTATRAHWIANVQKAIDLGVPHLSSYALTVEEKTALAHQIKTKKIQPLDEEEAHQQFLLLTQMAAAAGFEHYEISNLAKPGYRAVHNSQYWHGVPYLGVGPSAHSYDGKNRRWNRANNVLYSKAVLSGETYWEGETLTEADRYNETVMTRLRLLEGLPKNYVEKHFSESFQNHLVAELKAELAAGRIVDNGTHYAISPEHRFSADGIASNLFYL